MDAAAALKLDPYSEQGCTMLVQAARGLLSGTTNILMTFDFFEVLAVVYPGAASCSCKVRRIVRLGEAIIELLAASKVCIW